MSIDSIPASVASKFQIQKALEIYEKSFPSIERMDKIGIDNYLNQLGNQEKLVNHFIVIEQNELVVGVSIFSYIKPKRLGYLRYMAVDPQFRSQGIGSEIFWEVVAQIKIDANTYSLKSPIGLCWEVEKLGDQPSKDDTNMRRILFYQKQGGRILCINNYSGPPAYEGGSDVTFLLMFLPLSSEGIKTNEKEVARLVIKGILVDVWRCNNKNHLVIDALDSICTGQNTSIS